MQPIPQFQTNAWPTIHSNYPLKNLSLKFHGYHTCCWTVHLLHDVFQWHICKMPGISLLYHVIKSHSLLEMFIQDAPYVGRTCLSASWAHWRVVVFFPLPCNSSALNTHETLHRQEGRIPKKKKYPETSTSIQKCHCPKEVTSYTSSFCQKVSKMPPTFMLRRAKNSQVPTMH